MAASLLIVDAMTLISWFISLSWWELSAALPAQGRLVEVEFEALLLVEHVLDPPRQDHLLELAGDRVLVADEDVLCHLLGDGRAALGALARAQLGGIVDDCADQAGVVDTAVRPERLVLGRKEGIDQRLGKIDEAQLDTPLARIAVDDLAADPAHHGGQRRLVVEQLVRRRQVASQHHPEQQDGDKHSAGGIAEPAEPALFPPVDAQSGEKAGGFPANAVVEFVSLWGSGLGHDRSL